MLGCSPQEIPGTYDVELLIEGAPAPIEASMILTTADLEAATPEHDGDYDRKDDHKDDRDYDREHDRDYDRDYGRDYDHNDDREHDREHDADYDRYDRHADTSAAHDRAGRYEASDADDAIGATNSCLILPSADARDKAPRSVTFFEARVRGDEFLVPVTVFETSGERMEITKLSFFAGAIGGEVLLTGEDGARAGRIVGDRVAGPDAGRCREALLAFYARIDRLIQEAERSAAE